MTAHSHSHTSTLAYISPWTFETMFSAAIWQVWKSENLKPSEKLQQIRQLWQMLGVDIRGLFARRSLLISTNYSLEIVATAGLSCSI